MKVRSRASATTVRITALLLCLHAVSSRAQSTDAAASREPTPPAVAAAAAPAPGPADRVLRTRFVPNAEERQGEVRLLARGDVAVIQTILYSRVLKRVVGEILAKEADNWPPGTEGAADSARYTTALEDAAVAVWRRQMRFGHDDDRVQRLVIEFVRGQGLFRVALYGLPDQFVPTPTAITDVSSIDVLDLSSAYVTRNMLLIAQDALMMSESEAGAAIEGIVSRGDGGGTPEPAAMHPTPPARGTSAAGSR